MMLVMAHKASDDKSYKAQERDQIQYSDLP